MYIIILSFLSLCCFCSSLSCSFLCSLRLCLLSNLLSACYTLSCSLLWINLLLFSLLNFTSCLFRLSLSCFLRLIICLLSSSLRLLLISSNEIPTIARYTFKFRTLLFFAPSSVLIFLFNLLHATVH